MGKTNEKIGLAEDTLSFIHTDALCFSVVQNQVIASERGITFSTTQLLPSNSAVLNLYIVTDSYPEF
ncbi:hypothetical protein STEG23_021870 [Scotinomys teguina]